MNRPTQIAVPLVFAFLALLPFAHSGVAAGKLDPMSAMSESSDGSKPQSSDVLGALDQIGNEDPKTLTEKCRKVFGHEDFCHCIAGRLVAGTTFENYVKFILTPKANLLYAKSSPTRRRAIAAATAARDTCGKSSFGITGKAKRR